MDERFIEIQHEGVFLLRRFGEVRRGAGGKGLEYVVILLYDVLLYDVLVVVEIDGIEPQQLVKRTIYGHIPGLKLTNNDLQLFVQSGVGFENGKQFFGDEEDSGVDFLLDVDIVLADLVLECLKTRNCVVGERN